MLDTYMILDDLVECLSGLGEYDIGSHLDFTEKRPSPVVVRVSCDNSTQMNEGLPDYRIHYSILVDSLIADDEDGEAFKEVVKVIGDKLEEITDRDYDLSNAFTSPSVVRMLFDRQQHYSYSRLKQVHNGHRCDNIGMTIPINRI